jgi:hypothetical protein
MKFSGKELFDLGVPQNKIKFFLGKEFDSIEHLQNELKPKEQEEVVRVFTWVDWILRTFPVTQLLCALVGDRPMPMSKSELKRILNNKSLKINGMFPTATDECKDEHFPITEWVWFPKGDRKTTWL